MRSTLAALALTAVLVGASPARAIGFTADAGGGVWLLEATQFDFHVRIDQKLFIDWLHIGVRPGLALTLNEPNPRLAIPLDALVRLKMFFVYLDFFGGIYWIPSHLDSVRSHLGGGVGVKIWRLEIGFEVSYLNPSAVLMGRVGFNIWDSSSEKKAESEK